MDDDLLSEVAESQSQQPRNTFLTAPRLPTDTSITVDAVVGVTRTDRVHFYTQVKKLDDTLDSTKKTFATGKVLDDNTIGEISYRGGVNEGNKIKDVVIFGPTSYQMFDLRKFLRRIFTRTGQFVERMIPISAIAPTTPNSNLRTDGDGNVVPGDLASGGTALQAGQGIEIDESTNPDTIQIDPEYLPDPTEGNPGQAIVINEDGDGYELGSPVLDEGVDPGELPDDAQPSDELPVAVFDTADDVGNDHVLEFGFVTSVREVLIHDEGYRPEVTQSNTPPIFVHSNNIFHSFTTFSRGANWRRQAITVDGINSSIAELPLNTATGVQNSSAYTLIAQGGGHVVFYNSNNSIHFSSIPATLDSISIYQTGLSSGQFPVSGRYDYLAINSLHVFAVYAANRSVYATRYNGNFPTDSTANTVAWVGSTQTLDSQISLDTGETISGILANEDRLILQTAVTVGGVVQNRMRVYSIAGEAPNVVITLLHTNIFSNLSVSRYQIQNLLLSGIAIGKILLEGTTLVLSWYRYNSDATFDPAIYYGALNADGTITWNVQPVTVTSPSASTFTSSHVQRYRYRMHGSILISSDSSGLSFNSIPITIDGYNTSLDHNNSPHTFSIPNPAGVTNTASWDFYSDTLVRAVYTLAGGVYTAKALFATLTGNADALTFLASAQAVDILPDSRLPAHIAMNDMMIITEVTDYSDANARKYFAIPISRSGKDTVVDSANAVELTGIITSPTDIQLTDRLLFVRTNVQNGTWHVYDIVGDFPNISVRYLGSSTLGTGTPSIRGTFFAAAGDTLLVRSATAGSSFYPILLSPANTFTPTLDGDAPEGYSVVGQNLIAPQSIAGRVLRGYKIQAVRTIANVASNLGDSADFNDNVSGRSAEIIEGTTYHIDNHIYTLTSHQQVDVFHGQAAGVIGQILFIRNRFGHIDDNISFRVFVLTGDGIVAGEALPIPDDLAGRSVETSLQNPRDTLLVQKHDQSSLYWLRRSALEEVSIFTQEQSVDVNVNASGGFEVLSFSAPRLGVKAVGLSYSGGSLAVAGTNSFAIGLRIGEPILGNIAEDIFSSTGNQLLANRQVKIWDVTDLENIDITVEIRKIGSNVPDAVLSGLKLHIIEWS